MRADRSAGVNLGVLPGTGGTQRLAASSAKSLAIELMVKGELFSFDRAKEIGLVNEVFDAKDFWSRSCSTAKQFCPPHKASKAVGLIKRSGAVRRGGAIRERLGHRARAAAAAVPER